MRRAMLVLAVLALGAMVLAQGSSSSGNTSGSSSGSSATSSSGSSSSGSSSGSKSSSSSSKQSSSQQSSSKSGQSSNSSNLSKAVTLPDSILVESALVDGEWRSVLTNSKGMTLYYNDKGTAKKAACTGSCIDTWKPLYVADNVPAPTGESNITYFLSTLSRDNGGKQIELKGHPLYTFVKDQRQGEAKGSTDPASEHWHVATPALLGYG